MQTANQSLAFEPIELGEKLAFLACYSRYTIALQSERQEEQALELYHASSDVCEVIVVPGRDLPPKLSDQFVDIAQAFGVSRDDYPDVELGEFVAAQAVRPLVILTGCDQMSEEQLGNAYTVAQRTGLGLTLFSEASLNHRKSSQNAGEVLHTSVRKLNSRDVKQLLRRRAKQEVRVSESDIQQVIDRSRGNVVKADAMLADLVSSGDKKLGLPLAHMSMVIVFLVVVIGGFAYIPEQDRVEVSTDLPTFAEVDVTPRTSGKKQDELTPLTPTEPRETTSSSQSSLPAPIDVAQAEPETENSVLASEVLETTHNQPVALLTRDPNDWINNLPATAAVRTSNVTSEVNSGTKSQANWLASAPVSAYTLQIIGSHDEARIEALTRQHASLDHFGYFETTHRNQPWYVLTYGRFENRDAALNAISGLNSELRGQKPWARGVASIR